MKRFAGAAALAIVAHSGVALAQPIITESPDGPSRGRVERMAPDERPARPPGRAERGAQDERPDRATPRGAEAERPEPRGRNAQREQVERERPDEQRSRAAPEPQRPAAPTQPPRSAQPQQPDNRPSATENARPATPGRSQPEGSDTARPAAPGQDDNQRSGSTAQRPGAAQPNNAAQQPAPGTAQPNTAGQQPPSGTAQPNSAAQQPAPGAPQPNTAGQQQPPGAAQPNSAAQQPAPGAPAGQQSADAQTPEPDRRRIADTVRQRVERNEIRPVDNLGVAVSIGVEMPSRVQLQPLPGDIASIRPQYRDYRYTVSEREIVIVDPRSRRVVEVIARDGGGGRGADVYGVLEQRRDVRRWSRPSSVTFEQGVVLPSSAPYHDLPVELVERNPAWRGYQYIRTESDEIAIVEPRSRRIVEVVDQRAGGSAAAAGGSATTASTARQPMAAGNGDRRALVRILMNDARSGDIQGVEQLKGAVLSQDIALRPIPAEASEQDRQLSGYHYALLGDDVLIVDPRSREIIDVIE